MHREADTTIKVLILRPQSYTGLTGSVSSTSQHIPKPDNLQVQARALQSRLNNAKQALRDLATQVIPKCKDLSLQMGIFADVFQQVSTVCADQRCLD